MFFIKYLRTLGFSATNDIFAGNAWYFRNALVRANYTNLQKGIHETPEYLEAFLRNLLLNEKNELHNRNLHISGLLNEEKVDIGDTKVDIGDTKVDIENKKVDIGDTKVDIESVLSEKNSDFSVKTMIHIHGLFEKFGFDEVFGRSAVMELLELKASGASKLLYSYFKNNLSPLFRDRRLYVKNINQIINFLSLANYRKIFNTCLYNMDKKSDDEMIIKSYGWNKEIYYKD